MTLDIWLFLTTWRVLDIRDIAWRLPPDQPSGTCGMDPHQIRKDGTWYYLRKTGSFYDNSGTQQPDSGN